MLKQVTEALWTLRLAVEESEASICDARKGLHRVEARLARLAKAIKAAEEESEEA